MIVTKLEQWKNEHGLQPAVRAAAKTRKVVEIECVHCHRHFMRWSSTVSAYGRCESCSKEH